MKFNKTSIVIALAACSTYFMITAYNAGPGSNGWDCTGAETGLGNPAGCKGGGCHSAAATPGIAVAIELDSAGIPVTSYVGGMNYTVKLTGTNNTSSNLPRYGFQMGSITGASAVTTPTNAGTWATPYPASTHYSAPQQWFVVGVVEHSTALSPATGSGGNGTTYQRVFNWTAPAAGTGTVSFWAALNAVNHNGNADSGDLWNTNHIVITEETVATGIADHANNAPAIAVFPNPAGDHVTVSFNAAADYSTQQIRVMDISGKTIDVLPVANGMTRTDIDCSAFANGIYFFSLVDNNRITSTQKVVIAK